jgi:DNA-binding transcriptional MerR regulator
MTTPHVLARPDPPPAEPREDPDREDGLSTRDAARLTGVPAHTLRWYERVGLLPGVARGSSGRRRFSPANLQWITVLRALRATGMPVAVLQDLTEHHHAERTAQALRIVRVHRAQVLVLIGQLHRHLQVLDAVEAQLRSRPRPR